MSYRFFYKDLNASDNSDQNLAQYFSLVNVLSSLHSTNRDVVLSGPKNKTMAADLVAASVSRIHSASPLTEEVLERYLECCHDILMKRNYREGELHEVRSKLMSTDKRPVQNLIVGLGCQTRSLLVNRGKATAHVYQAVSQTNVGSTSVFFSGPKAAGRKRNDFLEEYVALKREFRKEARRVLNLVGDQPLDMIDLSTEVQSESTKQNVQYLVKNVLLSKYREVNVNIIIVSSNFHLIRVGQQIERVLRLKRSQSMMNQNHICINRLILVGSESLPAHERIVRDGAYVKSMVFEITQYFLNNNIIRY